MAGLTPKQQRFVEEYMIDWNASAEARRAGYSARTANRTASENLSKPDISAAIAAGCKAMSEATGTTVVQVIEDLKRLQRKAEEQGDFAPAIKATELLGKHVGAFVDRVQLSGDADAPIRLAW